MKQGLSQPPSVHLLLNLVLKLTKAITRLVSMVEQFKTGPLAVQRALIFPVTVMQVVIVIQPQVGIQIISVLFLPLVLVLCVKECLSNSSLFDYCLWFLLFCCQWKGTHRLHELHQFPSVNFLEHVMRRCYKNCVRNSSGIQVTVWLYTKTCGFHSFSLTQVNCTYFVQGIYFLSVQHLQHIFLYLVVFRSTIHNSNTFSGMYHVFYQCCKYVSCLSNI